MSEQDIHEIKRALVDNVPLSVTGGGGGGGAEWLDGTTVTLLSTELDSLTSGVLKQSAVQDNDVDLNIYGDLELLVGFTTGPAVGDAVADVWLLPSVDGTTFPEPTEDTPTVDPSPGLLVATFTAVKSQTAAQRLVVPGIVLPPRDMKFVLKNTDDSGYAASGNTLKFRPYKIAAV